MKMQALQEATQYLEQATFWMQMSVLTLGGCILVLLALVIHSEIERRKGPKR